MGRRSVPLAAAHRHRRATSPPLLRDGHRLPVGAEVARHRGRRTVHRRGLLHQPLAARGRRLHRQAGRASSAPARRASSRSRSSPQQAGQLPSSSARRTSPSRPTTARPRPSGWSSWTPTATPTARRPSGRAAASRRRSPRSSAAMAPPEVRRERFEAAWEAGELFAILGVFADQGVNPASNDIVAEMIREKIRADRQGPGDRRDAVPERPLLRHQAAVSRHRLLRDLQPAARAAGRPAQDADRARSPRPASTRPTSRSSSTRSCTPPASTR